MGCVSDCPRPCPASPKKSFDGHLPRAVPLNSVPAFFRWLKEKYPKCIVDAVVRLGALVARTHAAMPHATTRLHPHFTTQPLFLLSPHAPPAMQEETEVVVDGVTIPVNVSGPNPNRVEFDNLYLDMNGCVAEECAHPHLIYLMGGKAAQHTLITLTFSPPLLPLLPHPQYHPPLRAP